MTEQFKFSFPKAYPDPVGTGQIKRSPEDFIVEEELSFPLTGEGEHTYLKIKKTGQNTLWVIDQLARHFGVKSRDIGYAGLKDRNAVTTQWFSLLARQLSKEKLASFAIEGVKILEVQRHSGKLRQGAIKYNQFSITIRELEADSLEIKKRLSDIIRTGIPNYFDEQRFGRRRHNLIAAEQMFTGELRPNKSKQRLYVSAMRSWLCNLILASRVRQSCWSIGLDGDVFMLDGSKKYFHEAQMSPELEHRLLEQDIHPTAPLWGQGELQTTGAARELEMMVLKDWQGWTTRLAAAGMKQQRRACRVIPKDLSFSYDKAKHTLSLSFGLAVGSYATNLVREIIDINNE